MQTEHRQERIIDTPELVCGDVPDSLTKTGGVDGADLLHQHARAIPVQVDLGSERRRASALRRRRHEHNRAGEEFVGLDDDTEASPPLLVAPAFWHAKLVDVTSEHATAP